MRQGKRICILVQNYYEIDPRVRREAEALVQAGHHVDVIALRKSGASNKSFDLNGVHVLTIPIPKERGGKWRYIAEYLIFFLLASVMVTVRMFRQRYDVIQACTLPDFLIFAGLIPKLMGAKLILDMHEVMPEFYISKYHVPENHLVIRLIKVQERLSVGLADSVIAINEPIKDLLETRGLKAGKTTIIMNSVDRGLFALASTNGNSDSDERFVMMYHGTLTPLYGLDIALRAFSKASKEMVGAEFWIIGDGTERSKLASLVQEAGLDTKVTFLGVLPQQDIPQWLAKCDVGVLATRQDQFLDLSFSNKLPEYIVMGKPVIVSRLKAIHHYFSEEALAYFEPHNEHDLAARMLELYRQPERRTTLVDQAMREYSHIDWAVMRQRYVELVENL